MGELHIELWHVLTAGGALVTMLLGIYGHIWRMGIQPERKRREDVEKRLSELDTKHQLMEQRLESGDKRFSDICTEIKQIREALHRQELAFEKLNATISRSVWRGVAEESGA